MNERSELKCLETRIEVIPETVSQYTGLNDKNGKNSLYLDFSPIIPSISLPHQMHFLLLHNRKYSRNGKNFL